MISLKVSIDQYHLDLDKTGVKRALRGGASEIVAITKRLLRRAQGSGRLYSFNGGKHRASAPGEAPVKRTGNLVSQLALKSVRDGLKFTVRDKAFYALALEAGAEGGGAAKGNRNKRRRGKVIKPSTKRVMQPRPFLSSVLQAEGPAIEQRIKDAVVSGLKYKRGAKR